MKDSARNKPKVRLRFLLVRAASIAFAVAAIAHAQIAPTPASLDEESVVIQTNDGGTSGGNPQRYLLVSSFQCFQPGCQSEKAVLRYDADTGAFLGVHIANLPGPTGLALHPMTGHLLVACRDSDEVREFDAETGTFIGTFITAASGGLHLPQSLLFKSDGNLLVTSTHTSLTPDRVNGIIEYDGTTGAFLHVFVNGGFFGTGCGATRCLWGPIGMAFGPNAHLYVASGNNDLVIEYDGVTGAFINYFDTTSLDFPVGLAVRPATGIRPGNILVTSKYLTPGNPGEGQRILEFDKNTHELINPGGNFATGLEDPGPLMWGNDGTLLVSDRTLWNDAPNFSDKIVKRNASTGAFVGYATLITDSHLHYATGMIYVTIGCNSNAQCDDGNPCTDDTCNLAMGTCDHVNDNTNNPNDGLFCNGVETGCMNGTVLRDPPPNCSDALTCTTDSCNEQTDSCDHFVSSGNCLVAGACYADGAVNPANDCLSCNVAVSQTSWSNSPLGTSCGSPVDVDCDRADSCNGSGACMANLEPPGTPCGNNANTDCTDPDTCDGTGQCLIHDVPDRTPCDDGMLCTQTDQCAGGVCIGRGDPCNDPGLPVCIDSGISFVCVECVHDTDCPDDGLACTVAVCHQATHSCTHIPDSAFCDDGVFCNGAEFCNAQTGGCEPAPPPCGPPLFCDEDHNECVECFIDADCDDGLMCNGAEECVAGNCLFGDPIPNCCKADEDCDNGTICDGVETCVDNTCVRGTPLDCSDSNDCTDDICDPLKGCSNVDRVAGSPCGDHTDTVCNHADTCNGEGVCVSNVVPNGTSCSDGDFCNGEETCQGGACTPGSTLPNCCTTDADCDNHNICDGLEHCVNDVCVNGTPLNCDDRNACTTDTCHPIFGCQIAAAPSGTACGNPNGTPCDLPDTCDGEGGCRPNLQPNGTPCSDGNNCNGLETCQNFACSPGTPLPNCCTNNDQCSNGNVCDGIEVCVTGACMPGTPLNCEDGNPCTSNTCNPIMGCLPATLNPAGTPCGNSQDTLCDDPDTCNASGVCQQNHASNGTSCSDGLMCNGAETCQNGACLPGTPIPNCCNGNADCNNNNVCDGVETCSNGTCVPGTPLACNDGNPCTDDSCHAVTGCAHANNSAPCDDGNVCTGSDICVNGSCGGGGGAPACMGDDCTDCNVNNVRDDCEPLADCNDDSLPDVCAPTGDADGDCDVDLFDFATLQRCFSGATGGIATECHAVDVTLNGHIQLDDHHFLLINFEGP